MRRLLILFAVAGLAVACVRTGGPDPEVTTSLPPTTQVAETAPTTAPPDFAALCHGYLVLLRSGEPGPLRQELTDPSLVADLDTMLSSEGEFEAIAEAALRIEEVVVARCAERFALRVEPAADNRTALEAFLSALTTGDQAGAEKIAWENVVAQFTWSSVDGGEIAVDGDTATMPIGPTRQVECRAEDGVVVACRYREG